MTGSRFFPRIGTGLTDSALDCVALNSVAEPWDAAFNDPVHGPHQYSPCEDDLLATGARQEELHERARCLTRERFGNRVFVRAVVEVSNFCRENCSYCGMRRDNRGLKRYRATAAELAEVILEHRPRSVTDINIQSGEDMVAVREVVLPLIRQLRQSSGLGISVCLGTLTPEVYRELQEAGAGMYIMKFEVADPAAYVRLQAPGTLDQRLTHIRLLAASGWNVSSGFIAGLPGQGPKEVVQNLTLSRELPLRGCSVSPFVPGEQTPLASGAASIASWTLNSMAQLRLLKPDWVVPAVSALNLAEAQGYRHGLAAGANLVTINLTPSELREDYVIYKRARFIMTEDRVLEALAAEGLEPAGASLAEHFRQSTPEREPSGVLPMRG